MSSDRAQVRFWCDVIQVRTHIYTIARDDPRDALSGADFRIGTCVANEN
jgi:hypothetical protein